ncbi:anti-sigma factor domain-containing protein [Pelotomaculum propionicicum]|uniref:Anti-sigma-I factor RsgI n=1 Tax=Pelotomaculum propionicicum TaxID=258475 RepID=A0A4Y7RTJ5_9FIRM|nr:anti-sigma factor domain-containing protein [Pelotomaculum propionicicum]TEB12012.1 Anti-sigma-I factor RsgI [Pelotomaculum propionicicum]
MEERGIVTKIKGKSCIVITPEGEFKKVPLPGGGLTEIGQEITFREKREVPYLRHFVLAASMLLVFILAGRFYSSQAPEASAYMTIDINPSIELAVASDGTVVSGSGLNSDGVAIISKVKVKGRALPEAVELIIKQAITDGYLSAGQDNVVLATITFDNGDDAAIDLESVYGAIREPMDTGGLDAEVIITPVQPEVRREALKSGVSTGRFLLLQKSAEKSIEFSAGEVGTINLGQLEKEKKFSIIHLLNDSEQGADTGSTGEQGNMPDRRGIFVERYNPSGKNIPGADKKLDQEDNAADNKKQDKDNGKINMPGHDLNNGNKEKDSQRDENSGKSKGRSNNKDDRSGGDQGRNGNH